MPEIRAKDVTVRKLFRAECHLPGCAHKFAEWATYQEANAERLGHLTWHRMGAGATSEVLVCETDQRGAVDGAPGHG